MGIWAMVCFGYFDLGYAAFRRLVVLKSIISITSDSCSYLLSPSLQIASMRVSKL